MRVARVFFAALIGVVVCVTGAPGGPPTAGFALALASSQGKATAARAPGILSAAPALPVGFEVSGDHGLRARTPAYEVELLPGEVRLRPRHGGGATLTLSLAGARRVAPAGEAALPGAVHYLRGTDPAGWQVGVRRFAAARFADPYPGIDWIFRGDDGRVAYDFVVAPGADPGRIRMRLTGADSVSLGPDGALRMRTGAGEVVHAAPFIYQVGVAGREPVDGGFVVDAAAGEVGFWLGDYDVDRALVIDPAIGFSSYLGGLQSEDLPRIALGDDGGVFVVGTTASPDLPVAVSGDGMPAAGALAGDVDVFVAKLSANGATLEFLTYLGGSGMDRAGGVAAAADGSVWISGQTASTDFVGTGDTALAGPADAFVAQLAADGTAVQAARFIGGSGVEAGTGIALDAAGDVYVTGNTTSEDFAVVAAAQAALGGPGDAFVVRLDAAGGEVLYATYLGGAAGNEAGFAIAADAAGNAYVTGTTESSDFPLARPVQHGFHGGGDAFVARLTRSGEISYATTLGGSAADAGLAIAVDAAGAAYVTGQTESSNFPTRAPLQQFPGGGPDAFVTKIAADGGTVVYSTFLGGAGVDVGGGIAVDGAGNAHVTGMTASPDFPVEQSLQPYFGGGSDVFVVRINDLGSALTYATFSGGVGADAGIDIAVDGAGNAWVVGQTGSDDFPTFNAVQGSLRGPQDAFVTKYCLSLVFPEEREMASGAGGESFAVTTPAGCAWIAFSQAPWITLTSPNVVAGTGEVRFEVAPNATGAPRAGIVNIAGAEVTVVQAPATDCEYQISPASDNFYMQGGVGRINVKTRDDCAWSATTSETWISISGNDQGTGSGVVSYTVETNRTGRQRSGTIIVAGHTFVVFDWLR